MLKINPSFLLNLKYHFHEDISESDILRWLYNFDKQDWEYALILLNKVSYYSESRCLQVLADSLKHFLKENGDLSIAFVPIGEVGKSGGIIAYYISKIMKTSFSKVNYELLSDNNLNELEDKSYSFVLVDDFIGSASSAITSYNNIIHNKNIHNIILKSKWYCLCVAYMDRAEKKLQEFGIKCFGDKYYPAFASRHSAFGYPPRMNVKN